MTPEAHFGIVEGTLVISAEGGTAIWQGMPDGLPVLDLRLARDGASVFVLLDPPPGGGRVQNIVKISQAGAVMWRAELPADQATDAFVSLETDIEGGVVATTWSGYRLRLDPGSGCAEGKVFTK